MTTPAETLELLKIAIDTGAMTDAPVWENHKRGRNWAAKIKVAPAQPGGLDRSFLTRAHGSTFYYMVDGLEVGDAVEFGADYYTSSGKKQADRWYGVVLDITETELTLTEIRGGITAAKKAPEVLKAYRESLKAAEGPELADLLREQAELMVQQERIHARLEEIARLLAAKED